MRRRAAFAFFMAVSATPEAAIYKCHGSDGKIEFSETPCSGGTKIDSDRWMSVEERERKARDAEISRVIERQKIESEERIRILREARESEEKSRQQGLNDARERCGNKWEMLPEVGWEHWELTTCSAYPARFDRSVTNSRGTVSTYIKLKSEYDVVDGKVVEVRFGVLR